MDDEELQERQQAYEQSLEEEEQEKARKRQEEKQYAEGGDEESSNEGEQDSEKKSLLDKLDEEATESQEQEDENNEQDDEDQDNQQQSQDQNKQQENAGEDKQQESGGKGKQEENGDQGKQQNNDKSQKNDNDQQKNNTPQNKSKQTGGGPSKGSASNASKTAQKAKNADKAAKAAKTAKTAKAASSSKVFALLSNPIVWYIIVGIIILIVLIGIISFFTTLPDLVLGKIESFFVKLWDDISLFWTEDPGVLVHDKDIREVAQSLENMGYDLLGMGFAEEVTYKLDSEKKPTREINKVKSQCIKDYLNADIRAYVFSKFGGMLALAFGTEIQDEGANAKLTIDRAQKILEIKGLFSIGDTTTIYLEEWIGKYSTTLDLLLALHIGSGAPGFTQDIADPIREGKEETKVTFALHKTENTLQVTYNDGVHQVDNVLDILGKLNEDNQYIVDGDVVFTLNEDNIEKLKRLKSKFNIYTPYIKSVENHWYKDLVFLNDIVTDTYEIEDNVTPVYDEAELLEGLDEGFGIQVTADQIVQKGAPYYVFKEPYIMKLINEKKYTIYDGTVKDERPESYITPVRTLLTAISMLENVQTTNAEYATRYLRELITYYGYDSTKDSEYVISDKETEVDLAYEELYNNRVRGYLNEDKTEILEEEGPDKPPRPYEDFVPDRLKVQSDENNIAVINARTAGTSGFYENEQVQAIENGEVLSIDNNNITIKLDNNIIMNISNINVNESLEIGSIVYIGDKIGSTTNKDIRIIMKDSNHKLIDASKYINTSLLINA